MLCYLLLFYYEISYDYFYLGVREADINVAEGKKRARILASEAEKTEQINKAQGKFMLIVC